MTAIAPRLELRQSQSLVMTQQLQQSIKLLQLSSLELAEFIMRELEKNPLLTTEEQDGAPDREEAQGEETPHEAEAAPKSREESAEAQTPGEEASGWESEGWDGGYEPRAKAHAGDGEDAPSFEAYAESEVTLRDHLREQLNVEIAAPAKRIIGQHLIDLVDESGYIKEDTGTVAKLLGCDAAMIEATFTILHTFDPPGVCARSLQECLSIQLRDQNRLDPAMETLLKHLDLVAKGEHDTLRKLCGVDAEDIREMCAEIRALNPRPGSGFGHEAVQAVIPDVFLKRTKVGGWQLELNSAVLPRVLINHRYLSQVSPKNGDKQAKKYLSDQLAAANWLMKALDQRAQTILKVATEIVAQQDAFFKDGIRYLRPLTLRDIAQAVDLHESTVSRVTTAKYIATPRGTYELKYFFNASIQNADGGEGYSNKTVQYLIKELIDSEKPHDILSDDAIAEELKSRGVDIARRTVAKYRELMRISSSSARRREKAVRT